MKHLVLKQRCANKSNHFKKSRRAFSMVEVLISLTISATLLTATLAALNASFIGYKVTTEGASTNVVARIVMQRLTAMIRTGDSFGPYPVNPILTPELESNWIEFVSYRDPSTSTERVTRLERRDGTGGSGPYELWYIVTTYVNGAWDDEDEAPLLVNLNDVIFSMDYDVGPKLKRVTVDLIIQPDDLQDVAIGSHLEAPTIRLVASAAPRMED
ncbi:MAG: prepilin-type N-terminal cleavage/methylation domain-containing protein [Phycisphaerales bacterium]|nr:prepilin-type N-terminal cleavage/methylation domain-containing protein [Phycisphaerales bacterium]